jgi:hypothetical protein
MNLRTLLVNGLICLALFSCEKEHDDTIEKYVMTYTVKNNGDNSLTTIVVDTWTYFPDEKIGEWIGSGKFKNDYYLNYYRDLYLDDFDSVVVKTESQVYNGSITNMFIRFRFNEDKEVITVRDYSLPTDTIINGRVTNIIFFCA